MNGAGEHVAINGQRRAAGNAGGVRAIEDQRAKNSHLRLEQAMRVCRFGALERVRADKLREAVGLVRRSRADWPHLMDGDVMPALRELPRRFAAGKAPANDVYRLAHGARSE